jgi:hypothetical protein
MSVNPFLENNEEEIPAEEIVEEQPEEEKGNRTFIIVAVILGAIMLLSLACIAYLALSTLGPNRASRSTQVAAITQTDQVQQEILAQGVRLTQAAETQKVIPTHTQVPPTKTAAPSNTAVVARPSGASPTPLSTEDPRTATVAALFTQAAEAQKTVIPTSTALPESGFADEVGLPGLAALTIALLIVVFLARRLRTAT